MHATILDRQLAALVVTAAAFPALPVVGRLALYRFSDRPLRPPRKEAPRAFPPPGQPAGEAELTGLSPTPNVPLACGFGRGAGREFTGEVRLFSEAPRSLRQGQPCR